MELILQFKNYLLSLKPTPSKVTVKNYVADIKHFVYWYEEKYLKHFDPAQITHPLLEQFKKDKKEILSVSSIERHISSLRKFFQALKLQGYISRSPFEQLTVSAEALAKTDPYHLKDFKDFLYVYNASHLTIKNYLIDIKQFLSWAQEVTKASENWNVADKNIFSYLTEELIEEYKQRLFSQKVFSPSSINRKLSSLRKYVGWAQQNGLLSQTAYGDSPNVMVKNVSTEVISMPENSINREQNGSFESQVASRKSTDEDQTMLTANAYDQGPTTNDKYSKFPPLRILQKISNAINLLLEFGIIAPLTHLFIHGYKFVWKMKGKPLFRSNPKIRIPNPKIGNWKLPAYRPGREIGNLPKELFSPLSISTKHFSWQKKLLFHLRYTRPNWYKKYHTIALAHYFNWAILIIFTTAIGFGLYNAFVQKPNQSLASLPTAPLRILSFQGRLTDSSDNPISSQTNLRFIVYNSSSSTSSAELWEEERVVTPDQDGIFNVLLGSDGNGGTAASCGSFPPASPETGSCGIPSTLFSQNNQLWLGVTVENTPELTPRQQLATVAYATNSETLQGLPPITAAGAGTTNVVLALNSSGNLAVGAATTFQSTSGQFTLSGSTLALQTNSGSNSNVQITPDGSGLIDLQKPLVNNTLNNNLTSAAGSVEVDDLFSILATSAGQSAFTIAQNGAGPIISASHSGNAEFTVQNDGTIIAPKYATGYGLLYLNGTAGTIAETGQGASHTVLHGNGASAPTFSAIDLSQEVGSSVLPIANGGTNGTATPTNGQVAYGNGSAYAFTSSGSTGQCLTFNSGSAPTWAACATGAAGTNWWNMNFGSLFPINTTLDLLIGGSGTTSAKFAALNMTGSGTPTASVSAGLASTGGAYLTAAGTLATTQMQGLTLGATTTGPIAIGTDATARSVSIGNNTGATGVTLTAGSGNINLNAGTIDNSQGTVTFFGTPTSVTEYGAATTLNIGAAGAGTTTFRNNALDDNQATLTLFATPTTINEGATGQTLNLKGTVTLGTNTGQNVTINGLVNANVLPSASTINLGDPTHYWGTVYANNFISPVGGGTSGYWTLGQNVLSPVNPWNDLAVGGNATASATPWQVFATTVGVNTAGTATSSGGLSFRGTNTNIALLNGSILNLQTSVGGDSGLSTVFTLANNGNLTSSGNLALNGGSLTTTASTGNVFEGVTTLNLGDTNATTVHIGKNNSGTTTVQNNLAITGTFQPNGQLITNIIPNATTDNLGSSSNYFGSVYATNLYLSGGNYDGYWQLFSKVLSPFDAGNNDLAIGGSATSSALFQIFAATGNATTAGTLTFTGSSNQIQTVKNQTLLLGGNSTGTITLSPSNEGAGSVINLNGVNLATDQTSVNLLNATATNIHFANAATTLSIGAGSGTTTVNNGLTVTGTSTLNGNVILGATNSQSITANGVFNSSLVPTLVGATGIDTLYNLGASTAEWDTLYVRQIITPNNGTGGIAGYWQLTNSGILAPTALSDDLMIGSTDNTTVATQTARFQVIASGTNAGNVVTNSATAGGSALAIGANSVTNGNGASVSATFLTSGNLLNLVGPNPSGNLTGDLINVNSANHTYMTLTNQDLTIGGHKNNTTISNVVKVFLYDTSKDSDGGDWTNDARAQSSSWYNETLNTSSRGSTRAFPKKALIVVTNGSTSTNTLNIYDAKDNSLWMQFNKGVNTTVNMVGPTSNSVASSSAAMNGKIYLANSGSSGGVYVIDFKNDSSYKYDSGGFYQGSKNIQNRNTSDTYTLYNSITTSLVSSNVNDIAVNVINGKTYLGVATAGGGNGAVSLINESTLSPVANFGPANTNASFIALTSTGDLYSMIGSATSSPATYMLKAKHNAQNASGNTQLFDEVYGYRDSTHYGASTGDNNTFSSITFTPGPSATTAAQMNPTGLFVTQGTSTLDGVSNTMYIGEGGNSGSLAVIQENRGTPWNGSVKYYNSNDISEEMIGDQRIMLPMAGTGTYNNALLTSPDSDVSPIAASFTSKGGTNLSHISGVRGNGMTFDGTNYICTGTVANTCANNTNTDFANNNFSISFWEKVAVGQTSKVFVDKQATEGSSGTAGYEIKTDVSGRVKANITDGTAAHMPGGANGLVSVRAINDSNWHYITVTLSRPNNGSACSAGNPCTASLYIDGQLDAQASSTNLGSTTNSTQLTLMADSTGANQVTGSMDEFSLTANTLTGSEITHMYQVGYRALQNHASQTLRGVTIAADASQELIKGNSNVSAVSANLQNGEIYIGTQGGGVSIIGTDSDTLNDLYNSGGTITDDTASPWTTNNDFVQSIATGQSYGSGEMMLFGANNGGTGGAWMESNNTTLKDFFATNYNPFGATLDQSNLNVDTVLRVTNQVSTQLDNLAYAASSSASLADVFRVDNTGNLLSKSVFGNTTAMQFLDPANNPVLNLDTQNDFVSINSTNVGNATFGVNQLNSLGGGDILTASASGTTRMRLDTTGNLYAVSFHDQDNSSYFIDPATTTTTASLAGSMTFTQATNNINFNFLNNDSLNIQRSVGGDASLTSSLFVQGSTGNVGIGTTGPKTKLHIVGTDGSVVSYPTVGAKDFLVIENNGNNNIGLIGSATGQDAYKFYKSGGATFAGYVLYDNTNDFMAFATNGNNERLRIDSSGNVGIGTTSPSDTLDIAGNATESGDFTFRGQGTTHNMYVLNNGNLDIQTSVGGKASTTHALYIAAGGNVGIGTTTPGAVLDISGGSTQDVLNVNGTNNPEISLQNSGATKLQIAIATASNNYITGSVANDNIFRTQGGGKMLFSTSASGATNDLSLSSGNVGIGTTSPSDTLDIAGNATESGDFTFRGQGTTHNMYVLNNGNLDIQTSVGGKASTTHALYIAAGGNVGIGTTSPTDLLTVGSVNSGLGEAIKINGNNTQNYIGFYNNTTREGYIGTNASGNGTIFDADATSLALQTSASIPITFAINSSEKMRVDTNGNVGIGINNPNKTLSVLRAGITASFVNTNSSDSDSNTVLELHVGTATSGTATNFINFYAASTGDNNGTGVGHIRLSGSSTSTYVGSGADYAENFRMSDSFSHGDIIETSPAGNKRARGENSLIGVESNSYIVQGTNHLPETGPDIAVVGLIGQIHTHISDKNGPIYIGDHIAATDIPGYGGKALKAGQVVGEALEDFDPANGKLGEGIIPCPNGTASGTICGTIEVYVHVSWYDPQVYLTDTGDVQLTDQTPSVYFSIPNYYSLTDVLGQPITRVEELAQLAAGSVRAGVINSQQIFTNSLAIATDNISIAGQSLHDYIASIVSQMVNSQSSIVNSPIAEVSELHTNLISPLASSSAIALDFSDNSKIKVKNIASQQTVASIDNAGNATFSGQITSQNLAVNQDATISGTLYANNINANSIEGLAEIVSTLSAQNITNVNNIYFSTPSSGLATNYQLQGNTGSSSSSFGLPNQPYANIASFSAYLAYVPNLTADTAMFNQGLVSLGPTSLSDTTITGQLSIGTQLILANNSINVLGSDFQIQPLRQGGVSFEGGLFAIDNSGNVTFGGNAIFTKNLAANVISPLGNDKNLTLQLGQNSNATGAALATSTLNVQNASGSGIFNIDQLGNIIASGTATIAKLNLNLVEPVLAVSDTEVVATGSAGTATIKPHQDHITIDDKLVTPASLIYITPVGNTGVIPYLLQQTPNASFSVGIPASLPTDTPFNWLIVN